MTRFDNYLIVDWSAASVPKTGPDSICYCMLRRYARPIAANPATRAQAEGEIRELLANARGSTLCGFDFPLGYPAGSGAKWRAVWRAIAHTIHDAKDNANNRFAVAAEWNRRLDGEGPFWGCPRGVAIPNLSPRKPAQQTIAERRLCERTMRRMQPVWKLYGAGSVGSQALTGIPCVWRLRKSAALRKIARVWPFETSLACPIEPRVIFAEVYPSMVPPKPRRGEFKDQAQVRSLAQHFAALDEKGELVPMFAGSPLLSRAERQIVIRQEGWVLGVV
ncbi:MAG: hypothetical protein U0Q16_09545 [Bryobacteraceae bacterium]